jgi:hypothetical protein
VEGGLVADGELVLNLAQCVNTYRHHDYYLGGKANYAIDGRYARASPATALSSRSTSESSL